MNIVERKGDFPYPDFDDLVWDREPVDPDDPDGE